MNRWERITITAIHEQSTVVCVDGLYFVYDTVCEVLLHATHNRNRAVMWSFDYSRIEIS